MEKVDNMQEQMGIVSREMEILRNIERKCRQSKHCNRYKEYL